ncbi:hypothetical protein NDU88_003910 [Pleurodeles waltl]|uniref:Uncharacterized protein n=1 Tax=Pleurodeles waltl TaxID=8319 RepID=A0AAV7WTT9_PLEWA|nr:hypothetical protein NDU88_003910 [Pleurodeles waltl]
MTVDDVVDEVVTTVFVNKAFVDYAVEVGVDTVTGNKRDCLVDNVLVDVIVNTPDALTLLPPEPAQNRSYSSPGKQLGSRLRPAQNGGEAGDPLQLIPVTTPVTPGNWGGSTR